MFNMRVTLFFFFQIRFESIHECKINWCANMQIFEKKHFFDKNAIDEKYFLKSLYVDFWLHFSKTYFETKTLFWQKRDFWKIFFEWYVCVLFWFINMFEKYMWKSKIKCEMINLQKFFDAIVNMNIKLFWLT
jgi:hypothetical protein